MKQQPDDQEETQQRLVNQIHDLAGELGTTLDELENVADAENYEYQVHVGLADAVAEILDLDPVRAVSWFGCCLISCGVNLTERLSCLLDSLTREIEAMEATELDEADDEKEDADE